MVEVSQPLNLICLYPSRPARRTWPEKMVLILDEPLEGRNASIQRDGFTHTFETRLKIQCMELYCAALLGLSKSAR